MPQFHGIVEADPRRTKADRMFSPEDIPADTHMGRVRRFVALEKERKELEARIKIIEDEERPLKEQIGDVLEEAKSQGLDTHIRNVDGLTVFLKYNTWARPKDGDMARLCDALVHTELRDLIHPTVDLKTLSAVVREKLENAAIDDIPDDQILPHAVMEVLQITTTRNVQTVSGRSKKSED